MTDNNSAMTFWDHLDVLRGSLLRMAVVTVACAVVAFAFKDAVFAAILAPKHDDFILYRLLAGVNSWLADGSPSSFHVELINTGLAEQFKIHVKTSLYVGLMAASPYCLYELFRFVSPGLYPKERRYGVRAVVSGYVMFLLGVALCYFLIFPLTFVSSAPIRSVPTWRTSSPCNPTWTRCLSCVSSWASSLSCPSCAGCSASWASSVGRSCAVTASMLW